MRESVRTDRRLRHPARLCQVCGAARLPAGRWKSQQALFPHRNELQARLKPDSRARERAPPLAGQHIDSRVLLPPSSDHRYRFTLGESWPPRCSAQDRTASRIWGKSPAELQAIRTATFRAVPLFPQLLSTRVLTKLDGATLWSNEGP